MVIVTCTSYRQSICHVDAKLKSQRLNGRSNVDDYTQIDKWILLRDTLDLPWAYRPAYLRLHNLTRTPILHPHTHCCLTAVIALPRTCVPHMFALHSEAGYLRFRPHYPVDDLEPCISLADIAALHFYSWHCVSHASVTR